MRRTRSQLGLSMIELMIGLLVGLFIAGVGSTLLIGQLRTSRSLLNEARLTQDLRTAVELVTRDLRRSGHWGGAADATRTNPYAAVAASSAASDAVGVRYSMDLNENNTVDSNEQFGFRLRAGVIELQLGAGNWQALTDAGTLTVTSFSLTPELQTISLDAFCSKPCAAHDTACPPHLQVLSYAVQISAKLVSDSAVVRSAGSIARVRNDVVVRACAV